MAGEQGCPSCAGLGDVVCTHHEPSVKRLLTPEQYTAYLDMLGRKAELLDRQAHEIEQHGPPPTRWQLVRSIIHEEWERDWTGKACMLAVLLAYPLLMILIAVAAILGWS